MRLTISAFFVLPAALRVACLGAVDNGAPALEVLAPLRIDLQAEVDQIFIEEVCPDYTNYARVKQYVHIFEAVLLADTVH
jgi:hypothetical protein